MTMLLKVNVQMHMQCIFFLHSKEKFVLPSLDELEELEELEDVSGFTLCRLFVIGHLPPDATVDPLTGHLAPALPLGHPCGVPSE